MDENLKNLFRDFQLFPEYEAEGLVAAIGSITEGSPDRSVAITAFAMVDDSLERALTTVLHPTNGDLFKGAFAPMRGFSGKLQLGLALGMINQEHYFDLNKMREIRNKAGHVLVLSHQVGGKTHFEDFNFSQRSIIDLCNLLKCPESSDKRKQAFSNMVSANLVKRSGKKVPETEMRYIFTALVFKSLFESYVFLSGKVMIPAKSITEAASGLVSDEG